MITLLVPEYNMKMNRDEAIALHRLTSQLSQNDCRRIGLTDSQERVIQDIYVKLDEVVGNVATAEQDHDK